MLSLVSMTTEADAWLA